MVPSITTCFVLASTFAVADILVADAAQALDNPMDNVKTNAIINNLLNSSILTFSAIPLWRYDFVKGNGIVTARLLRQCPDIGIFLRRVRIFDR